MMMSTAGGDAVLERVEVGAAERCGLGAAGHGQAGDRLVATSCRSGRRTRSSRCAGSASAEAAPCGAMPTTAATAVVNPTAMRLPGSSPEYSSGHGRSLLARAAPALNAHGILARRRGGAAERRNPAVKRPSGG